MPQQFFLQSAYFNRDDIAYRGAAKFFAKSSEEEREHANKFLEYLSKRGGKPHFKQLPVRSLSYLEKIYIYWNFIQVITTHQLKKFDDLEKLFQLFITTRNAFQHCAALR